MALPFALDHINLWLLRDEIDGRAGWTVVDCCISRDEAKAQWEQIFATQLEGLPILRVIVTHMHPDHIGLAHWLCERWRRCRLWISATDYNAARLASQSTTGFGGEARGALLRLARPDRPGVGGEDPRPHQLLPQHGAGGAAQLPAHAGRRHGRASAGATGAASAATAMRPSTSRCTARR